MKQVEFALFDKQLEAYYLLCDAITNELVYGGGARGGKTVLGCFWITSECINEKPGSAWLVAREELKALKRTTLRTFFWVLYQLGLKQGEHFHYNAQDMVLTFANSSVVFFSELKRIPSDPEFDRLGSYDLTGAWIDEAQEVVKDAKDSLQFRFTVLKGLGWVTIPKTLYTCNPSMNWIGRDFWRPLIKEGKEIEGSAFITSLYTDNPYIDHEKYKKAVLRTRNKPKIERLLRGNFEYDDDPARYFSIENIMDLFTNVAEKSDNKFISGDVARKGRDKMPIGYWEGLQLKEIIVIPYEIKSDTKKSAAWIDEYAKKKGVRRSRIVLDEDGVGGGVVDNLPGCIGFVNGSRPIKTRRQKRKERLHKNLVNYGNLKAQCYDEFARLAENGKIGIDESVESGIKDELTEELIQIKQKDADKDGKIYIAGKDIIRENIGRSPDYADMIMMRMYFEIKKSPILTPILT